MLSQTNNNWGALFDLDGVLIDTEGIYTEFWHDIDLRFPTGVENFEYVIKGNTLEAIMGTYFPDEEIREQILMLLKAQEADMDYRFFDGVERFLADLKEAGVRSAIVTSSNGVKMEHLFKKLPVLNDVIEVVITGDDVTHSKPDPEGYKLAARRLGLDSERCVVFEDSLVGVEAGRRAGGAVVGVATTNPKEKLQPMTDVVVDNITELTVDALAELVCSRL